MTRLTVKGIQAITEPGRYGDGGCLFLLVSRGKRGNLRRSWTMRLTVNGKRLDRGLGSYQFVSLAQARDTAFRYRLAARHQGIDPFGGPQRHRTPTFRAIAARVAKANGSRLAAESLAARAMHLAKYAADLMDRPVNQIGKREILSVLEPIWAEQPGTGRKLRTAIREVMAYAVAHDLCEHNPVDAINGALRAQRPVKEHMRSLPYQETPEAFRKITTTRASPSAKAALRFAILTACRRAEARGARWSEIDLEAREWRIPPERMKAGREHRVPLSDAAVAVLRQMLPLRRGDLVFPSPKGNADAPLAAVSMQNALISAGYRGRATVHGFRSSFRTWAAEQSGATRDVAEMALAHQVGNDVERSYARSDLFEQRRELMDAWAAYATA